VICHCWDISNSTGWRGKKPQREMIEHDFMKGGCNKKARADLFFVFISEIKRELKGIHK
jgi:hypothetical protein